VRCVRGMRRLALAVIAAVLVAAAALALAPVIAANGQGVTVYLGYLPEVSNWGPYEATGQAYVNAGEGRAHIMVAHMIYDPALRYEVWLARADDRDALFSIGTFEVDSTGSADVELLSPDLKPAEFRFLVISAEPAADDDPRPSVRRTIAGVFPNAMARTPTGKTVGFDDIWAQSLGTVDDPATAGSSEGATPPSPAANGAGEATPERAAGDTPPAAPPRLPVTGGNMLPPLVVAFTAVAGVASISLMVVGARRQRAAPRAIRDASRGEAQ
jgi:hypothetical protein